MLLRDVVAEDVDTYVRLRCDPRMMAELGGPQRPEDMPGKAQRDAELAAADEAWILMICPDDDPTRVAGTVTLWSHGPDESPVSEIGWMVLPEFQGRGLATQAVTEVLRRAVTDGRWGQIHAFPSVTNEPSNRVCRALGFSDVGEEDFDFADQVFRVRHWVLDATKNSDPQGSDQ